MSSRPADQRDYWDRVAPAKVFGHPLHRPWLEELVPPGARWLDFGCGYGRLCGELHRLGWESVVGLDPAPGMIARARSEHPGLEFHADDELASDAELGQFDAALCFTVWTSSPADPELARIMQRLRDFLRPGGLLYVSDLLLQRDERNRERYEASRLRPWGSFELEEGVRVRHFALQDALQLLEGFDVLRFRQVDVRSMNRNPSRAFQAVARLRESD